VKVRVVASGDELGIEEARALVARLAAVCSRPALDPVIVPHSERSGRSPRPHALGAAPGELADALRSGGCDIAVLRIGAHLEADGMGLEFAAILPRDEPWEVWVSARFPDLVDLPERARVAAGTALRRAQLLHARPDLEVVDLVSRGDPLAELAESDARGDAGIVLAAAAPRATGRAARIRATFTASEFTPMAGQGALALAVRAGDAETSAIARLLDCPEARAEVAAERAFVAALGPEGDLPLGAVARRRGGALTLVGVVATPDGDRLLRLGAEGSFEAPTALGERLAAIVLRSGGREIVEQARAEPPRQASSLRGAAP
jgi:hydroxymethylbilane synthase